MYRILSLRPMPYGATLHADLPDFQPAEPARASPVAINRVSQVNGMLSFVLFEL